jgi:hypothetical protein
VVTRWRAQTNVVVKTTSVISWDVAAMQLFVLFHQKQEGDELPDGCYTPGKNQKWWALSLLQNVESNVPTSEVYTVVCISASQNGDCSISEYERALGFQPVVSNMVSKVCRCRVQEKMEMLKIKHFHTAFSVLYMIESQLDRIGVERNSKDNSQTHFLDICCQCFRS